MAGHRDDLTPRWASEIRSDFNRKARGEDDGKTRAQGDRGDGTVTDRTPPSRAERDALAEDRNNDLRRGPAPERHLRPEPGQGRQGVDRAAFNRDQAGVDARERRIQHIDDRLNNTRGQARGDFERAAREERDDDERS
jgi:hypothetical protein